MRRTAALAARVVRGAHEAGPLEREAMTAGEGGHGHHAAALTHADAGTAPAVSRSMAKAISRVGVSFPFTILCMLLGSYLQRRASSACETLALSSQSASCL